jgi:hypothetical protein
MAVNRRKEPGRINFELIERLAEREERDWTYFGRLLHEREKKLRDPQGVLIEADRRRLKKRRARRRGTRHNSPPLAACLTLLSPGSLCKADSPHRS